MPKLPAIAPAEAVDLEIHVTTPWGLGGQHLEYVVRSPSTAAGFFERRVPGHRLSSPDQFQQRLSQQLEDLQLGYVGTDLLSSHELLGELTSIGHDLYRDLFPNEMQALYREVAGRVTTLLLISDEPWIPWELLRPHESDDDDFLCMRFRMSRWFSGNAPLAFAKQVRKSLCIETGGGPKLPSAQRERDALQALAARTPGLDADAKRQVSFRRMNELMEEADFDLLHLVGHGAHHQSLPAESKVQLPDRAFRVRNLSPQAEKRLRARRPVVFFNSCQVGRLSTTLTSLGGWAERWVRRCHCTGFLAPIWSVPDAQAARFAELFYHYLSSGESLGSATFLARHELRREDANDLTWLAYSLYGAPTGRIVFGDQPDTPAILDDPPPPPPPPDPGPEQGPEGWGAEGGREEAEPGTTRPLPGGSLTEWVSKHKVYIVIALSLLLVVIGSRYISPSNDELPDEPSAQLPADNEPDSEPVTTDPDLTPAEPALEEPPGETTTPPAEKVAQTQAPAKPIFPFPVEAPVPGKVAILVLNSQTGQVDRELAGAVRGALVGAGAGLNPFVASLSAGDIERLAQGDLSLLPTEGRAAWGAEYLLLATASTESLPQSAGHIKSFALTLDTQLVSSATRSSAAQHVDTQTGTGVSKTQALTQAAERCLRPIITYFLGE